MPSTPAFSDRFSERGLTTQRGGSPCVSLADEDIALFMVSDVLFTLLFCALGLVFGANLNRALTSGSVWAKNTLISRTEHPLAFGIATVLTALFSLACFLAALIGIAHLLHWRV